MFKTQKYFTEKESNFWYVPQLFNNYISNRNYIHWVNSNFSKDIYINYIDIVNLELNQ